MPTWQLETSLPELTPPPGLAGANEDLCAMNANMSLRRRERDQGADHGLKPPVKPSLEHLREDSRAHREGANVIAHGATWTSERVEQLKGCFGAGLTCSQIAAEIGVTRNAVIGKMNRLGLSRPKDVLARAPEPKRTGWRSRNVTGNVTRILSQHQILMALPREPQAQAEAISIHNGRGCSLLELSPGSCRWPISEPGAADFCFCGNTQVEGLPYCVGHARIAYKSTARSGARV
jgi:GcrA cell cycle regulator